MTQEQRKELLNTQIECETDEYTTMSESEKRQLVIQIKQDETLKWQLLHSKLYSILTIVGLVMIGVSLIIWGVITNFGINKI
jgi:hypothetical protein